MYFKSNNYLRAIYKREDKCGTEEVTNFEKGSKEPHSGCKHHVKLLVITYLFLLSSATVLVETLPSIYTNYLVLLFLVKVRHP